jgi:uncharacterized protein YkwD
MSLKIHYLPLPTTLFKTLGFFLFLGCFASSANVNGQTQPGTRVKPYQSTATASPNGRQAKGVQNSKFAFAGSESSSSTLVEATPIERRAFDLTNTLRVENGRTPLTWDTDLCRLARSYSEKMATLGFFAHVEPDGSDLRDRFRTAGIRYRAIAENIAYNRGFDDPAASTVQQWMDSSAHRNNLLGREYRASAVGVFVSSKGRVFITQLFLTR